MCLLRTSQNYAKHAIELGNAVPTEEPLIFLKSSASLRGLEASPLAFETEAFHHELELVIGIGKAVPLGALCAHGADGGNRAAAAAEQAYEKTIECIHALGLGLDLTRRGKQNELKQNGHPWTLAKSFSGSAIVGPMSLRDGTFDLRDISFELRLNGELRQEGHVNQMIFDVPFQLRYLNSFVPLLPGDLIFTGTPEGVGECRKGDEFAMNFVKGPRTEIYSGIL